MNVVGADCCNTSVSCVVMTGFRATGKTAVGKVLAGLLGYRFIDTDDVLTRRLGCSITDSVSRFGWQPFRDQEQALLLELSGTRETVLATGGGAVLHRKAWQKLCAASFVVWLQADIETITHRLAADAKTAVQRPALEGREAGMDMTKLLQEREVLYRKGADLCLSTKQHTPAELARYLCRQLAVVERDG